MNTSINLNAAEQNTKLSTFLIIFLLIIIPGLPLGNYGGIIMLAGSVIGLILMWHSIKASKQSHQKHRRFLRIFSSAFLSAAGIAVVVAWLMKH